MNKKHIDIDSLTREELYELNGRVVDRLKKLASHAGLVTPNPRFFFVP
jgi:hypothetical protein